MKLLKSKAGKIGSNMIEQTILSLILVVVLFKVLASLLPEAQDAGDELQQTGAPLGSLIRSDGVIWFIVMIGIIVVLIRNYLKGSK